MDRIPGGNGLEKMVVGPDFLVGLCLGILFIGVAVILFVSWKFTRTNINIFEKHLIVMKEIHLRILQNMINQMAIFNIKKDVSHIKIGDLDAYESELKSADFNLEKLSSSQRSRYISLLGEYKSILWEFSVEKDNLKKDMIMFSEAASWFNKLWINILYKKDFFKYKDMLDMIEGSEYMNAVNKKMKQKEEKERQEREIAKQNLKDIESELEATNDIKEEERGFNV